jgi:hypothetical protein
MQVGFYDFVALPLVNACASAFPGTQPLLQCLHLNYMAWKQQQPVHNSRHTPLSG